MVAAVLPPTPFSAGLNGLEVQVRGFLSQGRVPVSSGGSLAEGGG